MDELIPKAAERIRAAAKAQVSLPQQRHFITRLTAPEIYAYAPEGLVRFCKENKPQPGASMDEMAKFWLRLPTVFNKDAEKRWVQDVVQGAKEMTHGLR